MEHMTTELTHFIGGEHVKGTSGRFADVYNPATGEYAVSTEGQVSEGDYVYFLYDSFALYSIDKSGGGKVYRDLYFLDEALNVTDTRSCGARPTGEFSNMPDC